MKIRHGFVSNSSSSSFIIALSKKPRSAKELQGMMFSSETQIIDHPYEDLDRVANHPVGIEQAAQAVWNQLKDQKPLKEAEIEEDIEGGSPEVGWSEEQSAPKWPQYRNEDTEEKRQKDYAEYDAQRKIFASKVAKNFLAREAIKGKKLFRVSFSDNDGPFGSLMEHGTALDGLPHLRISHH